MGSVHTFHITKYPLEMHVVHLNDNYGTVTNTLNYGDGLAVLGIVFMEQVDGQNCSWISAHTSASFPTAIPNSDNYVVPLEPSTIVVLTCSLRRAKVR